MKIIQVIPFFGFGGAETMCENLTYELGNFGHDVIVISMFDYHSAITERLEATGVDVRYLNKKAGLDFSLIAKMIRIFRDEKPDVVHTHLYTLKYVFAAMLVAKVPRRVHTVHNIAEKESAYFQRKLNRIFFRYFNVIPVSLSGLVQDTVVKEYGLSAEEVPIVFNGVDFSNCIPKSEYNLKDKFVITHIGSFQKSKNHVGLINAFKLFHEKYPNTELNLIGYGELQKDIENYVKGQGLSSSVNFLGKQSNVYKFLGESDVFCLPSFYEGIPMSIIEAMGTGLPIVATAVGGIPDMLDENSALLVEVDSAKIAEAFEKYYSDVELREKHGKAALQRSNIFSATKMATEYLKIYRGDL